MKLEELYLFEAMSIAPVTLAGIKKDRDDLVIYKTVDDVRYQFRFYKARSEASELAGATDNIWAFTFRVAKKSRKEEGKEENQSAFKMQNFNKGMEFKVMPLAMGLVVAFLKKYKPQAFMFAADKDETSRVSLYQKIITRYGSTLTELGYSKLSDRSASMDGTKHLKPFIFVQKDLKPKSVSSPRE